MCSELALVDHSPYTYIHLHCCGLVVSGSDGKTAIAEYRDRSSATDARGQFRVSHLSSLIARRQAGRVRARRQYRPALGR